MPETTVNAAPVRMQSPLDDADVVRRVVGGDVPLFEVLMRRHNQRVYRTIRAILRNEAEVEDAMQQTYLHAYANLSSFAGASSFSTWLTRIAVNEALGRLRGRSRLAALEQVIEVDSEETMPSAPRDPEREAAARESLRLLERAVDRLPPAYRTVYMLREIEELSTADVAQALGITEEAVKVRLHRARLSLRDALAEEVGQAAPQAFTFLAPRCDRIVAAVLASITRGAA